MWQRPALSSLGGRTLDAALIEDGPDFEREHVWKTGLQQETVAAGARGLLFRRPVVLPRQDDDASVLCALIVAQSTRQRDP